MPLNANQRERKHSNLHLIRWVGTLFRTQFRRNFYLLSCLLLLVCMFRSVRLEFLSVGSDSRSVVKSVSASDRIVPGAGGRSSPVACVAEGPQGVTLDRMGRICGSCCWNCGWWLQWGLGLCFLRVSFIAYGFETGEKIMMPFIMYKIFRWSYRFVWFLDWMHPTEKTFVLSRLSVTFHWSADRGL